jgi:integrase
MAWLEKHPTSGRYKVCFRWKGRQYKKTVKTTDQGDAKAILRRLQENVGLVERGRMEMPDGADVAEFLLSDGKMGLPHKEPPQKPPEPPRPITLGELRDKYLDTLFNGAVEANTLDTVRLHLRHVVKTLGKDAPAQGLQFDDLQRHVDHRSRKQYRGRPLSPVTLRKEVASFRACWNWGVAAKKVTLSFPGGGLRYPKKRQKPAFKTWQEVDWEVARGGLDEREQQDLWDCVFLTLPEIAQLLAHVKRTARQPFIYPMFAFAAHTGARRSEMLRVKLSDIDLDRQTVVLEEKKRVPGEVSSRRVPLSPFLTAELRDWLAVHPGGRHLFAQKADVIRSRRKRKVPGAVSKDEAHDHFVRTLAGSKWQVLRGWHVFRHSFRSNCAAAGIDQRLIDAWVGHTTEEMRRRYRHLIPNVERQAIAGVFGQFEVAGQVQSGPQAGRTT